MQCQMDAIEDLSDTIEFKSDFSGLLIGAVVIVKSDGGFRDCLRRREGD